MHAGGKDGQGSFKSQFKKADASGARHALIFGADELAQGMVTVKPLRDATAAQVQRPLAELASWGPGLRPRAPKHNREPRQQVGRNFTSRPRSAGLCFHGNESRSSGTGTD
jgi:hypothetical protein